MTALDDALASPSPVWVRPDLTAYWKETRTTPELEDLGSQLGDQITLEHSLDDGLPEPVTLTGQNNATGALSAILGGKNELLADPNSVLWKSTVTYGSTTALDNYILQNMPADIVEGDTFICVVATPADVTVSSDSIVNGVDIYPFLGKFQDGTAIVLHIFGGYWTDNTSQMSLDISAPSAWAMVISSAQAFTNDGNRVELQFGTPVGVAETVTGTTHTAPSATLARRGMVVSAFARVSSTTGWVPSDTELGEAVGTAGTNGNVSLAASALVGPGEYVKSATTPTSTGVAVMAAIPLEVADRARMSAREYFSPFNSDSPVFDWDRDTAVMLYEWVTMTADGPENTTLMWGQMADIQLKGDDAEVQMVSETRLDMMTSAQPPVVWAKREGANATWLMSWLLSQAGYFLSYRPDGLTRIWAPLHGSVHAHHDGPGSYHYAVNYQPGVFSGQRPPTTVDGPYMLGMFACMTATECQMLILNMEPSPYKHPGAADYWEEPYGYDQMCQTDYWGRIQVMLRADATATPVGYTPASSDRLWEYTLRLRRHTTSFIDAQVTVYVRVSDRKLVVQMGDDTAGFLELASTLVLPTDDDWHFVAFSWNWKTGETRFKMDATSYTYNGAGFVTTDANLPVTDAAYKAAGHFIDNYCWSKLPMAELEVGSGSPAHGNQFWNAYGLPDNAIARPLSMELEVIAEPTPREVWAQLAELARATASSFRCDEIDTYTFMPLSYFGESAQMTPQTVILDTDQNVNDLEVQADPTKTRNVVTVEFNETRVNDTYSSALSYSTGDRILNGKTEWTFTLDTPAAEIHNAPSRKAPVTLSNLTSTQVSTKVFPNNHYVSVNAAADGSGIYYTSAQVTVRIMEVTAHTVTLEFNNKSGRVRYLANNGSEVPFLNILGYLINVNTGYETRRDSTSVARRRERSLTSEMPWVQRRFDAGQVASNLVAMLCRPRHEVSVKVMGDPRRAPGQLVTVQDQQGTKASGTWRILSCQHNRNGAEYTQDLTLVQVLPPGVWDGSDGWDNAVWGE